MDERAPPSATDGGNDGLARSDRSFEWPRRTLVWDSAIRLFHWSLVGLVVTAWFTGGSGARLHEIAGYAVAALLVFRFVWGMAGTPYARFWNFIYSPVAIVRYLVDLLRGRATHYVGHNPAGGVMVFLLLTLLVVITATGVMQMSTAYYGVVWVETVHHYAANTLAGLIPLHVLGVVVSSFLHRENLLAAMIHGYKPVQVSTADAMPREETRHVELSNRVLASQGFAFATFLLASGIYYGVAVTGGRQSIPVETTQPTATDSGVAKEATASLSERDKQDYAAGGPDAPSKAWLLSSGGRIYDNWFATIGVPGPKETHPTWPATDTSLKGEATWRCKSCHGWDYLGRDGQLGRGGPKAPPLVKTQRSVQSIMAMLGNDTHRFSNEQLPEHARYRVAVFLKEGLHSAGRYVTAEGDIKGDPAAGRAAFQTLCAACHGFDGKMRKLGPSALPGYTGAPFYVGTKAANNPIEVLHKIRNGHPGAIMISLRAFPIEFAANILAFARTLPRN